MQPLRYDVVVRSDSVSAGLEARFHQLAAERGFSLNNCHAYSDSASDFPLLQSVGTPHAINPDARLRIKALAENWEIIDFRRFRKLNRWLGPAVSRFVALGALITPRSRGDKKND